MIKTSVPKSDWKKVMVSFGGDSELWWLRFLKKGFKHCFVVLSNDKNCVIVDPICCRTEICVFPFVEPEKIKKFFEANHYTVVETFLRHPDIRKFSFGIFSCVEVAKRVLGIHDKTIQTPYKLYRFLKNEQNKKKVLDIGK